ncbi:hypothetical protein PROFUN_10907 [Planoprotostelium fungivorum]|uniref:Nop domain-containing protein n=1 Tax=Planoprotostelium fungivorum TaxID=1890364 RepID=A0A2P6NC71_9EUKA|nr:hypothetical protein PROFUN_10907 [Planoprotostelium fungivorum]
MSKTLADEFMDDFGEEEGEEEEQTEETKEEEEEEEDPEMKDIVAEDPSTMQVELPSAAEIKQITKLAYGARLKNLVAKIETEITPGLSKLSSEEEYDLIVDANNMAVEITDDITRIHKFVQDRYAKKFPELSNIVFNPLDYARVVQRLGNEEDLTKIDLSDILPSATIMVLTVTATTTQGEPLAEEELKTVMDAVTASFALDESRTKIVTYVESRMNKIAPSLSILLGTGVAAKIMSAAGGLSALSKLPAGTIMSLGRNRKSIPGLASTVASRHIGFINETEVVTKAPPPLKTRALRLIIGRTALCARADAHRAGPSVGDKYRSEIERKLEKAQEPPPPKAPKPLPVPDDRPRKRRGGRKIRRFKEKYQVTELRKQANRLAFGVEESTVGNNMKSLGMLTGASGKVRLTAEDKGLLKKQQKARTYSGSSGNTSGLSSSLAFTSGQEMQLPEPPQLKKVKLTPGTDSYFGGGTMSFINKNA